MQDNKTLKAISLETEVLAKASEGYGSLDEEALALRYAASQDCDLQMSDQGGIVNSENPRTDGERSCQHYWIIEMPNGPTSQGVCRTCGDKKEFQNDLSNLVENSPLVARPRP